MKRTLAAATLSLGLISLPGLASGTYAEHPEAQRFADSMQEKHGFDRDAVLSALGQARYESRVIELIRPPATTPSARSWQRYRARFLDGKRIENGIAFWQAHAAALQKAADQYGVPPEIIVAIIGVETYYGRNTGNFETVSALATLAFDYPPRAVLFRGELEQLFLLAREQVRDPLSYYGSYAGALGYPQFLPSSIRNYAVDFDGNGQIDFDNEPEDAIGSVANYLARHGWVRGEAVAVPALVPSDANAQTLIDAGIEPALTPETLTAAGIVAASANPPAAPATLVDLATPGAPTEYWLGYRNFYVITRYNKSSFYAMAVYELARALRDQYASATTER
ncbi:lytic murein transglycosylase B [Aromatoleum petrolei]|uniref:Lytic murein transglycosylase B n=1 Tax=Aromatoleum petrolei TaxID=76116 RepID=A0ABX1MRE7_9RHOO|nr:lytic murein transglycosylase B [Aromatoleum petrolei]NMF90529.1 lytic murein transglycosylase B [Aromatoleum petrolei]QTQ35654.1 Membrane-bound lytic transglycosylase [Aromatoleum petrolei]